MFDIAPEHLRLRSPAPTSPLKVPDSGRTCNRWAKTLRPHKPRRGMGHYRPDMLRSADSGHGWSIIPGRCLNCSGNARREIGSSSFWPHMRNHGNHIRSPFVTRVTEHEPITVVARRFGPAPCSQFVRGVDWTQPCSRMRCRQPTASLLASPGRGW
jgi:hypothetical protein